MTFLLFILSIVVGAFIGCNIAEILISRNKRREIEKTTLARDVEKMPSFPKCVVTVPTVESNAATAYNNTILYLEKKYGARTRYKKGTKMTPRVDGWTEMLPYDNMVDTSDLGYVREINYPTTMPAKNYRRYLTSQKFVICSACRKRIKEPLETFIFCPYCGDDKKKKHKLPVTSKK